MSKDDKIFDYNLRSDTMTQDDWNIIDGLDIECCPFCGEKKGRIVMKVESTHKRFGKSKKSISNPFYVLCLNCLATGGTDYNPYKAIEKWNNRST